MSTDLVHVGDQPLALLEIAPERVVQEAKETAQVLTKILAAKPKKIVMGGKQYLEFEDWQVLGRFYGITARGVGEPEFVVLAEGVRGFRATSEAVHTSGRVLSRATAFCLTDEDKWGERPKYVYAYSLRSGGVSEVDPGPDEIVWIPNPNKPGKKMPERKRTHVGMESVPLFQLASMAQTRANAKALRNVLSHVAVLAGAAATPAEEVQDMAGSHEEAPPPTDAEEMPHSETRSTPPARRKNQEPEAKTVEAEVVTSTGNGKRAVKHPPDQHDDWKNPAALAKECLRLCDGNHSEGQALFKKATGAETAKGMKPSAVLQGWTRLTDLVNA